MHGMVMSGWCVVVGVGAEELRGPWLVRGELTCNLAQEFPSGLIKFYLILS